MKSLPTRKNIRLENFDYASPGAYFVTLCTADRENLFWHNRRGELRSPADIELSAIGKIVDAEIYKLNTVYPAVRVEKYCIMPDHIHMILSIQTETSGRTQFAPTIPRVIKQFKGAITKQIGRSVWQKSFYEHSIRNIQDYNDICEYIAYNPVKYFLK